MRKHFRFASPRVLIRRRGPGVGSHRPGAAGRVPSTSCRRASSSTDASARARARCCSATSYPERWRWWVRTSSIREAPSCATRSGRPMGDHAAQPVRARARLRLLRTNASTTTPGATPRARPERERRGVAAFRQRRRARRRLERHRHPHLAPQRVLATTPCFVIHSIIRDDGRRSRRRDARDAIAPNPSRQVAEVRFQVPRAGDVEVRVVDLAGREVNVLARGWRAAGPGVGVVGRPPLGREQGEAGPLLRSASSPRGVHDDSGGAPAVMRARARTRARRPGGTDPSRRCPPGRVWEGFRVSLDRAPGSSALAIPDRPARHDREAAIAAAIGRKRQSSPEHGSSHSE